MSSKNQNNFSDMFLKQLLSNSSFTRPSFVSAPAQKQVTTQSQNSSEGLAKRERIALEQIMNLGVPTFSNPAKPVENETTKEKEQPKQLLVKRQFTEVQQTVPAKTEKVETTVSVNVQKPIPNRKQFTGLDSIIGMGVPVFSDKPVEKVDANSQKPNNDKDTPQQPTIPPIKSLKVSRLNSEVEYTPVEKPGVSVAQSNGGVKNNAIQALEMDSTLQKILESSNRDLEADGETDSPVDNTNNTTLSANVVQLQEYEDAKKQIVAREAELSKTQEKIAVFEATISSNNETIKTLQNELELLREQNPSLAKLAEDASKQCIEQVEELQQKHLKTTDDLNRAKTKLQTKLKQENAKRRRALEEYAILQTQHAEEKTLLEEAMKKYKAEREAIENKTMNTIAGLTEQIKELTVNIKKKSEEISQAFNENESKQNRINNLQQEIETLAVQLELAKTKNPKDINFQEVDDLRVRISVLESQLEKSTKDLEESKTQQNLLRQQNLNLETKLNKVIQDAAEANNLRLVEENDSRLQKEREINERISYLDTEIEEKQKAIDEKNGQIELLEAEIREITEKYDIGIKELNEKIKLGNDEITTLKSENSRLSLSENALQQEANDMQGKITQLTKLYEDCKSELRVQCTFAEDFNEANIKLRQSRRNIDEFEQLQNQVTRLQLQNTLLQEQIEELKSTASATELDLLEDVGVSVAQISKDIKTRGSTYKVSNRTELENLKLGKLNDDVVRIATNNAFPSDAVKWYNTRFLKFLYKKVTNPTGSGGEVCDLKDVDDRNKSNLTQPQKLKCTENVLEKQYDRYIRGLDKILYAPVVVMFCIAIVPGKYKLSIDNPYSRKGSPYYTGRDKERILGVNDEHWEKHNYNFSTDIMYNVLNDETKRFESEMKNSRVAKAREANGKTKVFWVQGVYTELPQASFESFVTTLLNNSTDGVNDPNLKTFAYFRTLNRFEGTDQINAYFYSVKDKKYKVEEIDSSEDEESLRNIFVTYN